MSSLPARKRPVTLEESPEDHPRDPNFFRSNRDHDPVTPYRNMGEDDRLTQAARDRVNKELERLGIPDRCVVCLERRLPYRWVAFCHVLPQRYKSDKHNIQVCFLHIFPGHVD